MELENIQIRDPFILLIEDNYYLFGSTDKDIWSKGARTGFDVYKSEDLQEWQGPFAAFRPKDDFWGKDNFWAPEVYPYNGAYYMFASFRNQDGMRGTGVLRGKTVLGPYEPWSEGPVTPSHWMSLDGTLYLDKENKPWLVFCHEWVQIGDGTVCALPLSMDLRQAIGDPIQLFSSSEALWSREAESKSNRIKGYVTDGCNLFQHADKSLLLLWSCMGEEGYCIGYARSLTGDLLGPWEQCSSPLYSKDGGHGMIFKDKNGQLFLSIHAPNRTPEERARFIPLKEIPGGLALTL